MKTLRAVVAILIALFALLTLLDRFVLIELLLRRIGLPLLLACAEALAIVAAGRLARRAPHYDLPLDFLIGYPLFGALCFVVGLMNVSVASMTPLVALGVIGFFVALWIAAKPNPFEPLLLPVRNSFATAAIGIILGCGFVAAQAPPSTLDELAYHLAVPRAWVVEARAIELPLLSHSYFPLGIESADLPLLTILGAQEGGVASHLLHFIAAIATTLLIVKRTGNWLAAASIIATPALAITAGWSLVDWPLLGLFVALTFTLETGSDQAASAATAAGLLTKYTFLPFVIFAWVLARRRPKWIALLGLIFFARNAILTGNPFAPFFAGDTPHVAGYRDVALADYVFEGAFIDEALGVSLFALAVLARAPLALASLACALALFLLGPSARILVPFLTVAALSWPNSLRSQPMWVKRTMIAFCGIGVVLQTFLVVWLTGRGGAFALMAGAQSDEQYLAKARASHAAVTWLNAALPADSRTLLIGLGETYWFAHPVRGGGNFDGPRMSRYLEMHSPEALREKLRADGITHVAIVAIPPPTKESHKREERQTTLSPAAQRMLARTLDRYAGTFTARGDVTLFALK